MQAVPTDLFVLADPQESVEMLNQQTIAVPQGRAETAARWLVWGPLGV